MAEGEAFSGRVVSVWVKPPADGCVLENASVQKLADRLFIVGQLADPGASDSAPIDPRIGFTFWFPLDDVLMITEFSDLLTAQAYYARHNASTARKNLWQRLTGRK